MALAGCELFAPKTEPPPAPQYAQTISREELMYRLQLNVQRLGSLRGQAQVEAIDMNQVVPASYEDEVRRREGKNYKRTYNTRSLDGYIALDRSDPRVGPRGRFWAEVTGVGRVLETLAIGDKFWVKLPKPERKLADLRSVLYFGEFKRGGARPENSFAMRPQDIIDLLACQEILNSFQLEKVKAFFLETWPDYYILHVLRVNPDEEPPVRIYSKIWVERHSLTVAIHQLYDMAGEMVAEARFVNYVRYGEDVDAVLVPLQMRFLWPRDKVALHVYLRRETVEVNRKLPDQTWRSPRSNDAELVEVTSAATGLRFTPIGSGGDTFESPKDTNAEPR